MACVLRLSRRADGQGDAGGQQGRPGADRGGHQRGEQLPVLRRGPRAIARIRTRNARIADQVATDWRSAELDDRQRAIIEVAVKIAVEPWTVNDEVLVSLRAHGLTDDDIWDVGSISAFFAMSNRLARLTSTMPNDEFYLLGRLPPTPSAS